jgi:hypothetical protein
MSAGDSNNAEGDLLVSGLMLVAVCGLLWLVCDCEGSSFGQGLGDFFPCALEESPDGAS